VAVYPADLFGCGHYRLLYAARVLIDQGHDVEIVLPTEATLRGRVDAAGNTRRIEGLPDGTDVVVMQRVTHEQLATAIPQFRKQGIAVVIDMDDDLSAIHPSNPAHMGLHPRARNGWSWQAAQRSCRDATLVTVSTSALTSRYPSRTGGAHVLDNFVPASYLDVPRIDTDGDVGYGGSLHSHPDDVPEIGFAIERLISEGLAEFRLIGGASEGFAGALGLAQDPPTTGPLDIEDWPMGLATLGVGVAPLSDTRFNQAKSRLKVLEMSALGVPWVASPRAEYSRFHEEAGVGFLARRPRDWYRHLRDLATNAGRRADESAAGREACRGLTYEANAWRWMEAWERAHALEHGRKPATYPGVR
jgi:hypothetical protein